MKLFKNLTRAEKKEIRKVVENELSRYRISKQLPEESWENETREFHRKVELAVSKLPEKENFLIVERYLSEESEYRLDYQIHDFHFNPPISAMTYGTIRDRAMIKIALFLNLDTGVELTI